MIFATDSAFGIIPLFPKPDGLHFLLVQQRQGQWGFPKGHAEPGETAIATACREFEEETGITAYTMLDAPSFSEQYVVIKQWKLISKTVVYFPALIQNPIVHHDPKEIRAYDWLPYGAARKRLSATNRKHLLQEAHQHLQNTPWPLPISQS
jgi:bis(5'-nucleosidyl)-tetraphosphatase